MHKSNDENEIINSIRSVERWTIDRIDREAGMARIEMIPMHEHPMTSTHLEEIKNGGLEPGMSQSSLWDMRHMKIDRLPIKDLARKLLLRDEEQEILSENMVFYRLTKHDKDEETALVYVWHLTPAAREAARKLYKKVTGMEDKSNAFE